MAAPLVLISQYLAGIQECVGQLASQPRMGDLRDLIITLNRNEANIKLGEVNMRLDLINERLDEMRGRLDTLTAQMNRAFPQ